MEQIIGVFAGGDSPEREVSLSSARGVFDALLRREHTPRMVEIGTLDDLVPGLNGIDFAFNCLHGGTGEDGTVQMLFEVLRIPYNGSGPLASARAMDKAQAKTIFRSKDLPTPAGVTVTADSLETGIHEAANTFGFPMIVKPRDGGSTISVHRVESEKKLQASIQSVLSEFGPALIEPFIAGRELTVGILRIDGEETPLPIIEIRYHGDLFDYGAKYTPGKAEFLEPAPLPPDVTAHVQDIALRAHKALGCFGFSRVDFRLGEDGIPYLLEVNTLPGMTPLSDLPRAAALISITYDDLVEIMLDTATSDNEAEA